MKESKQTLTEGGKQQNVLASTTYLITIQQVLEGAISVGITRLAGIRMLGPQKLENEAHIFQNVGRMRVDALAFFDLRHAGWNEFCYRHELLDPSCIHSRGGTHHLFHALARLELYQADATRGTGRDGRVSA